MTMFSTLDEWCSPTQKSSKPSSSHLHGQLEVLVDALGQRLGRIVDRHHEHAESQRRTRSFMTFDPPDCRTSVATSTPSRAPCSRIASSVAASTGMPSPAPPPWRAEFQLAGNQDFVEARHGLRRLHVGHGFVHQPAELVERAERRRIDHEEADAVARTRPDRAGRRRPARCPGSRPAGRGRIPCARLLPRAAGCPRAAGRKTRSGRSSAARRRPGSSRRARACPRCGRTRIFPSGATDVEKSATTGSPPVGTRIGDRVRRQPPFAAPPRQDIVAIDRRIAGGQGDHSLDRPPAGPRPPAGRRDCSAA